MSVQIVENWSDVRGEVRSCGPSPAVKGFAAVELAVRAVDPVPGFANLLGEAVGTSLLVHVPQELADSLSIAPGSVVSCRVRRAGPDKAFVHRDGIVVRRGEGA